MNVSIIAGGAGFVGCNLLPLLAKEDRHLMVLDNLCRGREEYLDAARAAAPGRVHFIHVDLSDRAATLLAFNAAQKLGTVDEVWHLAANSDIPAGVLDANVDLRDTFMTTFSLLEAMKVHQVPALHFASSSAIYGDLGGVGLHESIGPLLPISNYGAMKLASEALISAAAESYLVSANLFRFPNVVGIPATHGVILDFVNKLAVAPDHLDVLGDGSQQKAYLHVSDLVAAMLRVRGRSTDHKVEVVNIGPTDEGVTVRWIAEQVVARVKPGAEIRFGTGNKGWVGDVPKFKYLTDRMQAYGWAPALGSPGAVARAIDEIARQQGH
ncbi:MAG: NAD-dependent epimerase/dehydratase family protein [Mitsuaria chitosanitabida]|uniref:NAD-dependent epimerase/dehydratase family protein n=1 Tax=Roseateles chitosanitabidus TaxID=65048 RepID=UPI001B12C854|nr:NAD-dependent epimerase/dehydratase family protein [Roseateles chitosanitabidus]MBO9688668.1 NAD-dependent epimerase/dehydratase family protein [Roseateles chitosanitabidus]